ncbi:MAG: TatD family hydrolase [Patescibacteria group bacterium]|nr:TatD family hydrolase [Patescibacteria group bacterium]
MFIDSHAHLDFKEFDEDFDEVLRRAKASNVLKIINIGADIERSKKAIKLTERYDYIFPTAGIHPEEELPKGVVESIKELENLIKNSSKIVAVGECGLDYYLNTEFSKTKEITKEERTRQIDLFEAQIKLAQRRNLPLVIHLRNGQDNQAYENAIAILEEKKVNNGVVHCFTFGPQEAKTFLKMGLYIGFTGIVTYKNAENVQEAAKVVPLDRLLIETDCPFLAPGPYRGKRNEPAYVIEIAKKIAEIKDLPLEKVEEITTKNVETLFNI